jgi:hypothetical protein
MCNGGDSHARLDFSRLRRKPSTTCTTQKKLKRAWRFQGREGGPRSCDGPNWGLLGVPQSPQNPKIPLAGRPSVPYRGRNPGARPPRSALGGALAPGPVGERHSAVAQHASSKSTAPAPAHARQNFPRLYSGRRLLRRPFQKRERRKKKGGRCRTRVAAVVAVSGSAANARRQSAAGPGGGGGGGG